MITFFQFFLNFVKMKRKIYAAMAAVVEQVSARREENRLDFDVEEMTLMKDVMSLLKEVLEDPVEMLPEELQCRLLYSEAFREAVRAGLLTVKGGRVVTNRFSGVLYAYLFGRLFADDYPECVYGRTLWGRGGEIFPVAELQRYFHVRNLKQLRWNSIGNRVPRNHQVVDRVFDER